MKVTRRGFLKLGGAAAGTAIGGASSPRKARGDADVYAVSFDPETGLYSVSRNGDVGTYRELPGTETEYLGSQLLGVLKCNKLEIADILSKESRFAPSDDFVDPESVKDDIDVWHSRDSSQYNLVAARVNRISDRSSQRQRVDFIIVKDKGKENQSVDTYTFHRMRLEPRMYLEGMFQEALPIGSENIILGGVVTYMRNQDKRGFDAMLTRAFGGGGAGKIKNKAGAMQSIMVPSDYEQGVRSLPQTTKWIRQPKPQVNIILYYNDGDQGIKPVEIKTSPEGSREFLGYIQPIIDSEVGYDVMKTYYKTTDGKKCNVIGLPIE